MGVEIVKLFPEAPILGFIKAVPFTLTSIMPTGGVSPDYDNLEEMVDAGAYCVGMGS